MALFNYATKELSAKIVYYGPGLSGKTTNIEMVHKILRPEQKGRLISLPTEADRTLFFDFLPVELGEIKGFKVRFHLYTVPGQVFYNATRRLVLQGVDGVVFVADSQVDMGQSNLESLKNLKDNLASYGKSLADTPFIMQFNKRDLRNISPVVEMNSSLNPAGYPSFEASAIRGEGVTETLVCISRLVFQYLRRSLLPAGELSPEDDAAGPAGSGRERGTAADDLQELPESALIDADEALPLVVEEAPRNAPSASGGEEVGMPEVAIGGLPESIEIPAGGTGAEAGADAANGTAGGAVEQGTWQAEEIEVEIPEPTARPGDPSRPAPRTEPRPDLPSDDLRSGGLRPDPRPASRSAELRPDHGSEELRPGAPSPNPSPGARVLVEAASGTLTFLRFEEAYVASDGNAVLPMTFMDGEGNILRIRLRIGIEEGGRG